MKRLKTYKLFESIQSIEDDVSIVKQMLLELDLLDLEGIENRVVIRKMDGKEFIRVTIRKIVRMKFPDISDSFSYNDISEVVETIKEYLLSENYVIDYENDELSNKSVPDGDSYNNITQYQIKFVR